MVSLRYREKFNSALYALAVMEGDVRARLRGAYRYLRMLREDEVPVGDRREWNAILSTLTQRGPSHFPNGELWQNPLEHTLSRMRNRSGRKIAERIYALARSME